MKVMGLNTILISASASIIFSSRGIYNILNLAKEMTSLFTLPSYLAVIASLASMLLSVKKLGLSVANFFVFAK